MPEGSYSTNPFDGSVRIREVKQMVQALHNAGIKVIMDVVYNHMFSPDNWFERSVPDYFLRRKPNGALANGSGCGCDMATERKMFRRFIVESVTFWAREYHMDGFRFDLMGLIDVDTMNAVRAALNEIPGRGHAARRQAGACAVGRSHRPLLRHHARHHQRPRVLFGSPRLRERRHARQRRGRARGGGRLAP